MSNPLELLILEKIKNFVVYLLEQFPDNQEIQDKYSYTVDYIESNFMGLPLLEFRRIMKENRENNPETMITTFASDYNYNPEILTPIQKDRIQEYIMCFKDLYEMLVE